MNRKTYRIYPTHALYNAVGNAVNEMRINLKAPDALIGGAFLTGMSICCQGDIDVLLTTGQRSCCALFVATFADSGERKTATDKLVLEPIYARDAAQVGKHQVAMNEFQGNLRYWIIEGKSIQKKLIKALDKGSDTTTLRSELDAHAAAKPIKPVRDRMVYQSITERPLMEALQGDDKCIVIVSDEGSIVVNGGAMNKLAPLNKAWDGPSLMTFDRADGSIEARNPRVTVSFMIQEKPFLDFLNKRGELARETGFLARFLVSAPASTQGFRYMSLNAPVWEHLPKFHRRMTEMLDATAARRAAGDTSRKLLSFAPEAKEVWVSMQNSVESKLHDGGELASVRDFASKSTEIVGRLAAIMHHFEGLAGDVISRETLQRAMDVVTFYFAEYVELFGNQNDVPQDQKDVRALGTYLHGRYWLNGLGSVPRNVLRKSGPIRHQGRFETAIQRLVEEGAIVVCHEQAHRQKGKLWVAINADVFSRIGLQ